jgi:hypothetical protein
MKAIMLGESEYGLGEMLKVYTRQFSQRIVGIYKDEACTQEFQGGDRVGPDTTVYAMIPIESLFPGGPPPVVNQQIGQISGSITLTDIPTPRPGVVRIYAENSLHEHYILSDWIDLSEASGSSGTVDWTIPFYEGDEESSFWTGLSGMQNIIFGVGWVPGEYESWVSVEIGSASLDMTNKDNVAAGHLGTASLATVSLGGTISLNVSGMPASEFGVRFTAEIRQGNYYSGYPGTSLALPAANARWSVFIPRSLVLDSPRLEAVVMIEIFAKESESGYYSPTIFDKMVWAGAVPISGNSNININETIRLITLSGAISYSGGLPLAQVNITAHTQKVGLGHTYIDSLVSGASWLIAMEPLDTPTSVAFSVNGHGSGSSNWFSRSDLAPTTVHNTSVSGIILDLGDISQPDW